MSIIILGNGPSLKGYDLTSITLPTIGMNAAYRYWERINWYPTYYACLDTALTESHQDNLYNLHENTPIKHFFLRKNILNKYPELANSKKILFLEDVHKTHPLFIGQLVTTGSYACRFALYLKYTTLYMIGIDCNYVERIPESRRVGNIKLQIKRTPKQNPNYFFDDYQRKGDIYHIPNVASYTNQHGSTVHYDAFVQFKKEFPKLEIYNCSQISTLKMFPYKPLPITQPSQP